MREIIRKLFADDEQEEVPPGFLFVLFTVFIVALTSLGVGIAAGYLLFG